MSSEQCFAFKRPFTLGGIASAMVPHFSFLVHLIMKTFVAVPLGCNPCPLLVSCTLLPSLSQIKTINFHFLAFCGGHQMLGCISRQHTLVNFSQGPKAWRNRFCSKSNPQASKSPAENRVTSSSKPQCYTLSSSKILCYTLSSSKVQCYTAPVKSSVTHSASSS